MLHCWCWRQCGFTVHTDNQPHQRYRSFFSESVTVSSPNEGVSIEEDGNTYSVTGTEVVFGITDEDLFNPELLEGVDVIEVYLPLAAGEHTIVQTNPVLEYFAEDPSISHEGDDWVKTKNYNLAEDDDLAILIMGGEGTVTVLDNETLYTFNYNLSSL